MASSLFVMLNYEVFSSFKFVGLVDHDFLIRKSKHFYILDFSDIDWGSNVDHHKSTTRYCILLRFNLVF